MADPASIKANLKFLVVDDSQLARNLVKTILKSAGFHEVYTAENAPEALKVATMYTVNFIICDWNMGGMSGLDLLREMKKTAKMKNVPFIMLTSEAYRENIAAAIQEGVTDYIAKPFSAQVLIEKVSKVLGLPS